MAPKRTVPPSDFGQAHPGLGVLRMASLLAEADAGPDEEMLNLLFEQVEAGVLLDTSPSVMWPELVRGLMGRHPSKTITILRECGALAHILPEFVSLFGVPQVSDGQSEVDIGAHTLKTLAEAALCNARLAVRFALLTMNVGKSDSPREHLPVHYKHIERGSGRIEAICKRFAAPAECRDLALLALVECERVHRVSKVRAGPIAAMLERLGAFTAPERFGELMTVCACDFRAHAGRSGQPYSKAELLNTAFEACIDIDATGSGDAASDARALAIAQVFQSQRWSSEPA